MADLCAKTMTFAKLGSLSKRSMLHKSEVLGAAGEFSGNSRLFLSVQSITDERWDWDGTQWPTKVTTRKFQEPTLVAGAKQWGNLTSEKVAFGDGHESETSVEYFAADENLWRLGRVKKRVMSNTRPTRTVSVAAANDAALPPTAAGPPPISPAVLAVILSLLLDD